MTEKLWTTEEVVSIVKEVELMLRGTFSESSVNDGRYIDTAIFTAGLACNTIIGKLNNTNNQTKGSQ